MIRNVFILALLCLAASVNAAPDRIAQSVPQRVLFIGNSYTYTNMGMPTAMQQAALHAGSPVTIEFETSLIGGSNLTEHWDAGNAQAKIRQGGWDIVVLQTRSTEPLDSAGRENFYTYARMFHILIDSVGARTGFFMTWPRQNADTWLTISTAYDSIGTELDAIVVPVGTAFENTRANRPDLNLYSPDGSHPSVPGTWLGGLMFYTAFTGKSPVGNGWNPDSTVYSAETAAYLQGAAWNVMRDYIETPCTDGTAPSVPTGLAGEAVSTSSVRISWDASAHAACGVRRYRVLRAGTFIGETYDPYYIDTGLLGGTEYAYTVTAISLNGIESAESSPVNVTTMLDVTPPVLTGAENTRKPTRVFLTFNEQMETASCENPDNYSIDKGITVTAASLNGTVVTLATSTMTANETYTVTVTGVKDNASVGNTIGAGAQASFAYIPLSLMTDAVGYWPLDNSLEDYSTYGNNATWQQGESFAPGQLKQCIALSGDTASPYITIASDDALDGMAQLTISIWAKKTDAGTGGYLMLMHTGYRLILGSNSISGYLYTVDGSVNFSTTVAAINDTEWHHYCLSYDGTALKTYVDAVLVDTDAHTGAVVDISRGLTIGKNPWGSRLAFNGRIDELRIYETAKDSAGVAALYNDQPYIDGELDSAAVRSILDRNALGNTIPQVTERDAASGRVLVLDIDSLGVDRITDRVGQLTAMRALYCAGSDAFDTSLVYIDPAIGNCTALETLVIKDNALSELPDEITALTNLTHLDVSNNMLCGITGPVKAWLDTYDPDWADAQTGCSGIAAVPVSLTGRFSAGIYFTTGGERIYGVPQQAGVYLLYNGNTLRKTLITR